MRFAGWLSQRGAAAARSRAAAVLVPSRWDEVCPYSVLDAIAAGVPVLASDRGGLPELVGAEASLPAEDVDAWAAALTRFWRQPAKRAPFAEGARERFGEERYLSELLAIYEGS